MALADTEIDLRSIWYLRDQLPIEPFCRYRLTLRMSRLTQQAVAYQLRKDERFRRARAEELGAIFEVHVESAELAFGNCGFQFANQTAEQVQHTVEPAVDAGALVHLLEWLCNPGFRPLAKTLLASLSTQETIAACLRQKGGMFARVRRETLSAHLPVVVETVELPSGTYRLVAEMGLVPDKTPAHVVRRL